MVEVVEGEHGGMINKFMGDGFMALFGVGADTAAHADEALATAQRCSAASKFSISSLDPRGHPALAIGIGMNTGPAIVGSIGSAERMEFTGIGTTVNVASRIESLNKTLGTTVLLSQATRAALRHPADSPRSRRKWSKAWTNRSPSSPSRIWLAHETQWTV